MKSYLVTWRIDIESGADNPEQAAAQALIIMRDNDEANTANVFEVTDKDTGTTVQVDLCNGWPV